MRLWTLHPRYLDAPGLTAVWREALLAQAVLRGGTLGYRHHPQLQRFRECSAPRSALAYYLAGIYAEANARGYDFDRGKLMRAATRPRIDVTEGQLHYEWAWLLSKLRNRNPGLYRAHRAIAKPDAHPLFSIVPGSVSEWERARQASR
jgi:hypothetical protein